MTWRKNLFPEFKLFRAVLEDAQLSAAFVKMQEIYVFSQSDVLQVQQMSICMEKLNQKLLQLDEGLEREHIAVTDNTRQMNCY